MQIVIQDYVLYLMVGAIVVETIVIAVQLFLAKKATSARKVLASPANASRRTLRTHRSTKQKLASKSSEHRNGTTTSNDSLSMRSSGTPPPRKRNNSVSHALNALRWNSDANTAKEPWEINAKEIKFDKVIGFGSCGNVWLAHWHGTPVAVKTFKDDMFQNQQEFMSTVIKEIRLMSSLHHPNVVMFLGASISLPELCLLLEYCDNGCLSEFLRNERVHKMTITMDMCLKFNIDVARGVKYLHERCDIIQRDLKSRNVLIDGSLNAKLTDFGLSRVKKQNDEDKGMTACGTPAWTAPEIVKCEGDYTEKVDVYSFGILMWEILTRQEPYENKKGISGVQIAFAAAHDGLRPEVPSFCPDSYKRLMTACWADKPSERPGFADILERLFEMKKLQKQANRQRMAHSSTKSLVLPGTAE